jgi:hypothetical protein
MGRLASIRRWAGSYRLFEVLKGKRRIEIEGLEGVGNRNA